MTNATRRHLRHAQTHWGLTVVGSSGIAALFLPFTYDYSPVRAALHGEFLQLALPFFLCVLATAAAIRWLVAGSLSRTEQAVGYTASAVSAAMTLFYYVDGSGAPAHLEDWLILAIPVAILFLGVYLLVRKVRRAPSREFGAVLAIQVAYLANAAFCLAGFLGEWQIGAYLVLVTAVAYSLQMALVTGGSGQLGCGRAGT